MSVDVEGLLKIGVFGELPVVAQQLAVVRGEDNQGVLVVAEGLQRLDQAPDLGVHFAHHAVIGGAGLAHLRLRDVQVMFSGVEPEADTAAALVIEVVVEERMLGGASSSGLAARSGGGTSAGSYMAW